jgi:prophage regulatory protein
VQTLIKLSEVKTITRRSRSRIYSDMQSGHFPRAVKIGARSVAWVADEINAWVAACIAERAK